MTFQLYGDEIVFNGKTVGRLLPTVNATDRMNVEEAFKVWKSEEEIENEISIAIEDHDTELKQKLEACIDELCILRNMF